jgi:hypothetical protein
VTLSDEALAAIGAYVRRAGAAAYHRAPNFFRSPLTPVLPLSEASEFGFNKQIFGVRQQIPGRGKSD